VSLGNPIHTLWHLSDHIPPSVSPSFVFLKMWVVDFLFRNHRGSFFKMQTPRTYISTSTWNLGRAGPRNLHFKLFLSWFWHVSSLRNTTMVMVSRTSRTSHSAWHMRAHSKCVQKDHKNEQQHPGRTPCNSRQICSRCNSECQQMALCRRKCFHMRHAASEEMVVVFLEFEPQNAA
jgi:hypothetical protein